MNKNKIFQGLTSNEALRRQVSDGFNELDAKEDRTFLKIAAEAIREPMFLLLIGAGSIYLIMGDPHEALILLGFVFVIIGLTIFQERRTEKVLEALRDISSPRALAIRDGRPIRISGREVVCGDILILSEGDRIPADGNVLVSHELFTDESMLTGESAAVSKNADNMKAFAGTVVVKGQGTMEVVSIGQNTELGKIGKSLRMIENEVSPLQKEIAFLARRLTIIGIVLCLTVTLLYVFFSGGWLNGLLAGITLAMGILPQEFPVIMIIFMAFGARRIAEYKVLTRHLSAIETLGETTVLCVDKTGTLTQNKMTVASIVVNGKFLDIAKISELPEEYHELIEYCVLASEIDPHDPMEQSFHRLAAQYLANTEHLHSDWDLAKEYEITPELLAMTHLWRIPENEREAAATKGAPEAIADLCHMGDLEKQNILEQATEIADRGLRVLGVAKAMHGSGEQPKIQHDFDFEFLGLIGLADPIRDEVPNSVEECRLAGIRVVMITGDHPRTAQAIALQAGIDHAVVMTGAELELLDKNTVAKKVSNVSVFARVTPQQKLLIVDALKSNGEVVAMTGDGVNDAPALKSAHIGIAMGKRGTDVAREAASLVLLDDNFSAIVEAIRLGRRIFGNLRQAMIYTLAVHIPIIGLSILPLLLGLPLVLAPIHIAFLELVIDPACSIVFEAEKADNNIMRKPPRSLNERLISSRHLVFSIFQGAVASIVIVLFYRLTLSFGIENATARAMAFIALITANAVLIFSIRSHKAFSLDAITGISRVGILVILTTFVSLVLITTTPFVVGFFAFSVPSFTYWLLSFGVGIGVFILFEAIKFLQKSNR
jgi:Ca2+-transporting ATPase